MAFDVALSFALVTPVLVEGGIHARTAIGDGYAACCEAMSGESHGCDCAAADSGAELGECAAMVGAH